MATWRPRARRNSPLILGLLYAGAVPISTDRLDAQPFLLLVCSHSSAGPELHTCSESSRREEVARPVGSSWPGRQQTWCCLGSTSNYCDTGPASYPLGALISLSLSLQNRKRNPCWLLSDEVASISLTLGCPLFGMLPSSHNGLFSI